MSIQECRRTVFRMTGCHMMEFRRMVFHSLGLDNYNCQTGCHMMGFHTKVLDKNILYLVLDRDNFRCRVLDKNILSRELDSNMMVLDSNRCLALDMCNQSQA